MRPPPPPLPIPATRTPHLDSLGEFPGPSGVGREPAVHGNVVSDGVLSGDPAAAAARARGHEEGDVRYGQAQDVDADRPGEDEVHGRAAVHVGHEDVLVGGHLHGLGRRRSGGRLLLFCGVCEGERGGGTWRCGAVGEEL